MSKFTGCEHDLKYLDDCCSKCINGLHDELDHLRQYTEGPLTLGDLLDRERELKRDLELARAEVERLRKAIESNIADESYLDKLFSLSEKQLDALIAKQLGDKGETLVSLNARVTNWVTKAGIAKGLQVLAERERDALRRRVEELEATRGTPAGDAEPRP